MNEEGRLCVSFFVQNEEDDDDYSFSRLIDWRCAENIFVSSLSLSRFRLLLTIARRIT